MVKGSIKNSIFAWGWTLSAFLLISYFLCIAFGAGTERVRQTTKFYSKPLLYID